MKKLFLCFGISALLAGSLFLCGPTGCAYLSSKTGNSEFGTPYTKVRCYTLFDSQSALAKLNVKGELTRSNEWASGTYIGALNQSSSSTNINDLIGTVVGAAVKAAVTVK